MCGCFAPFSMSHQFENCLARSQDSLGTNPPESKTRACSLVTGGGGGDRGWEWGEGLMGPCS